MYMYAPPETGQTDGEKGTLDADADHCVYTEPGAHAADSDNTDIGEWIAAYSCGFKWLSAAS